MTATYTLQSNRAIYAPGVIAWAINGYKFQKDREALLNVVLAGWPTLPEEAAKALLNEEVPYEVKGEGDDAAVVFSYEPSVA